ncbi:heterokaryon incompatibility protein [Rutstroemia sp. NJR-2017a WRK4]|nr:heterokaryon incompatibility protein [Rutstroemia sp. NJR-2017a WRK4]
MPTISDIPQSSEKEGSHGEEPLYSQGLCDNCQHVIDQVGNKEKGEIESLPFYQNSSLMTHSAENGCLLCGQFLALIETEQLEEPVDIGGIDIHRPMPVWDESDDSDDSHCLHRPKPEPNWVGEYNLVLKPRDRNHCLYIFPDEHEGSVDIKRSRKDALPLIKQWLDDCSSKHNCANNVPEKPFFPTRLVYTKSSTPRLCLAVDILRNLENLGSWKYATLSHCWGTLKSVTLSQSNIDSFKKEMPPAALTQTFKDAIEVAQALGIDYIWIDSLCIIQDKDSDDWAVESAKMSDVYGNSHLNIAATSAPDCRHGLFQDGKEHRNTSFRAWTSRKSESYHCVPPDMYKKAMLEAPLIQRGWVVQERLLSSRTVHFTSTQVFWECNRGTACEAYPLGMTEYVTYVGSIDHRTLKKSLLEFKWDHIVQLYTSCSLSFGQDKLPAISGVANAMKIFKKCEYVAGLWADDTFPLQLCWKVSSLWPDRLPKPKYRAPSWSWAAVDSPVTYSQTAVDYRKRTGDTLHSCIEIYCFEMAAINTTHLEEASGLSLVLKCKYLLPATVKAVDGAISGFTCYFDYLNQNMDDLYLLIIAGVTAPSSSTGSFNHYTHTEYLILEKTSIKQGQYRRVGYFHLNRYRIKRHEGHDESRTKLEQGSLEERDLLPPDCYIKDLRSEKSGFVYQIEII